MALSNNLGVTCLSYSPPSILTSLLSPQWSLLLAILLSTSYFLYPTSLSLNKPPPTLTLYTFMIAVVIAGYVLTSEDLS